MKYLHLPFFDIQEEKKNASFPLSAIMLPKISIFYLPNLTPLCGRRERIIGSQFEDKLHTRLLLALYHFAM